jgi:hypothetical protein
MWRSASGRPSSGARSSSLAPAFFNLPYLFACFPASRHFHAARFAREIARGFSPHHTDAPITSHSSPSTAFLIATHPKTKFAVNHRKQRIGPRSNRNTCRPDEGRHPEGASRPRALSLLSGVAAHQLFRPPRASSEHLAVPMFILNNRGMRDGAIAAARNFGDAASANETQGAWS